MTSYLSAEIARGKLIATGDFSETTAPNLEILDDIIEGIEFRLNDWLGFNAAPSQYQELLTTDYNGNIVLSNFPVLSILEVLQISESLVPADPIVYSAAAIWRQGRTLRLYSYPGLAFRVTYLAGYNPLPKEFGRTVFTALRTVVKSSGTSGDLSALDEPTKDVSSISIPGISKSFQFGKRGSGSGTAIEGTQAEKLFKSLESYRLKYIT